jgi:hypothetical protein
VKSNAVSNVTSAKPLTCDFKTTTMVSTSWHNGGMHAEAVKRGMAPSRPGLMTDVRHQLRCAECDTHYCLHYDKEAEGAFTFLAVTASEIIAARHPTHESHVFLQAREANQSPTRRVIMRVDLGQLLKKKPDIG